LKDVKLHPIPPDEFVVEAWFDRTMLAPRPPE